MWNIVTVVTGRDGDFTMHLKNTLFCNCAIKLPDWLLRLHLRFTLVWKLFRGSGKSGKLRVFFFQNICKHHDSDSRYSLLMWNIVTVVTGGLTTTRVGLMSWPSVPWSACVESSNAGWNRPTRWRSSSTARVRRMPSMSSSTWSLVTLSPRTKSTNTFRWWPGFVQPMHRRVYHWATWAMPPSWTAKNLAYGQKFNLREVAPMENCQSCCYQMLDFKTKMHQIRF